MTTNLVCHYNITTTTYQDKFKLPRYWLKLCLHRWRDKRWCRSGGFRRRRCCTGSLQWSPTSIRTVCCSGKSLRMRFSHTTVTPMRKSSISLKRWVCRKKAMQSPYESSIVSSISQIYANNLASESIVVYLHNWKPILTSWLRGAMVARLTPDQKVACSSHVGVSEFFFLRFRFELFFFLLFPFEYHGIA